jgi:single-stranded DNA-specific DHH superfamily exonuclease
VQIDVFNGDADGICALVQFRLANPAQTKLVTGVKRDIQLLKQVEVQSNDFVTVLDISLQKNRRDLDRILQHGAAVFYVDHHDAGEIPQHSKLHTLIDTAANTCTSLLMDQYLGGKFSTWAVIAAFGDNLINSAERLALQLSITAKQLNQLRGLGVCLNYNGCGNVVSDLHFPPDFLYRELVDYMNPFDYMAANDSSYSLLLEMYAEDIAKAEAIKEEYCTSMVAVYRLPDEAWARRISGVFSNVMANKMPNRAHAIISYNADGGYQISVRAPLANKTGANELCSLFSTGGGRKGAAGINHLPYDKLPLFITEFEKKYP